MSYSCLRDCRCPADGSACSLSSDCRADNFACKEGFKRFSSSEAKCYPIGCQQGALQVIEYTKSRPTAVSCEAEDMFPAALQPSADSSHQLMPGIS